MRRQWAILMITSFQVVSNHFPERKKNLQNLIKSKPTSEWFKWHPKFPVWIIETRLNICVEAHKWLLKHFNVVLNLAFHLWLKKNSFNISSGYFKGYKWMNFNKGLALDTFCVPRLILPISIHSLFIRECDFKSVKSFISMAIFAWEFGSQNKWAQQMTGTYEFAFSFPHSSALAATKGKFSNEKPRIFKTPLIL